MKDITELLNVKQLGDDVLEIELRGAVTLKSAEPIRREVDRALRRFSGEVTLNLHLIENLDSAGAALIFSIGKICERRGCTLIQGETNPHVDEVLNLFDFDKIPDYSLPEKPPRNFFESAGEIIIEVSRDFRDMTLFIGRFAISMFWSLRHPKKIKWGEVAYLSQRAGVEALPIVGLLSFLIGLVTAFSSAVQLRQFGANIYIADLVGIGMTREMGPLITAILLTGRSGSAFAAEIGTMKISDEIDALTVMGIKPHRYLVLPRLLAVMLVMPFLTLFADVAGILGGMLISIASLDLTPVAFLNQLSQAIGLWDVFSGVLKAFVFGILIAGVGCYRGLETQGGALSVGKSTTSSVVSGIFLIVAADSAFAIVFHYLGLV